MARFSPKMHANGLRLESPQCSRSTLQSGEGDFLLVSLFVGTLCTLPAVKGKKRAKPAGEPHGQHGRKPEQKRQAGTGMNQFSTLIGEEAVLVSSTPGE